MKFAETSDWRNAIAFETPMLASDVTPGDDARCVVCGVASDPRPRTELWAVKHRHPNNHDGHVRFYCAEHVPAPEPYVTPVEARNARIAARPAPRVPVTRRAVVPEKERAVCPDCFIEVSATGECGMCGQRVA